MLGRSQCCLMSSICTGPACATATWRFMPDAAPRYVQVTSIGGSTWNGPTPKMPAQCAALPSRSSTTKPTWNSRYSPSGHGCWYMRRGSGVIGASPYCGTDQDLLHHRCHEMSVDVVDRPAHQTAITRDGHRLLCVEMPAVEPHGTVEPQGVIDAEAGEARRRDALGVRSERHVEQEVVARVGEQRGMQERVVADIARK